MFWISEQQHQCSEWRGRVKNAMCDGMSTGETKESTMMRHWSGDIDFECEAKLVGKRLVRQKLLGSHRELPKPETISPKPQKMLGSHRELTKP